MNEALHDHTARRAEQKLDWRRRMSDNVAYALLVYTALQIFVTMQVLHGAQGSIMPYLALVVLVAAIIPACRLMEKRWEGLTDAQAADRSLERAFKFDRLALWICAIGLPFALTGGFLAFDALF